MFNMNAIATQSTMTWESKKKDYLSCLLQESVVGTALESLIEDIHKNKHETVQAVLCYSGSEDVLWRIVSLLKNDNSRISGNAAYILGTLAEIDIGCERILSLTKCHTQNIFDDLTDMLLLNDEESVMNAAGTLATLAESVDGRAWMLGQACIDETVERIIPLLSSNNIWTGSNAALILARLCIGEEGSMRVLQHPKSHVILTQLISSLEIDEAGRSMNAAFAIGRICDLEKGRQTLLSLSQFDLMISSLTKMLFGTEFGAGKNSCFALSCLAMKADGLQTILNNCMSDQLVSQLCELITSADIETAWFAAMTLRTIAAQPKGCLRLRDADIVQRTLNIISESNNVSADVLKEITLTKELLKCLDVPGPPNVKVLGSTSIHISWSKVTSKCGFSVVYQLLENNKCIYKGGNTEYTSSHLTPHSTFTYKLRALAEGDETPYTDSVSVVTEEDVPSAPVNLQMSAATPTQLKITWGKPDKMNGDLKGYHIYIDRKHEVTKQDTNCILSGLQPSTSYTIQICAATSKGKGPKSQIVVSTPETGDHCPASPFVTVLGRHEVHIEWKPPAVLYGRITRYEVSANGNIIYTGTDLCCSERHLTSDMEYAFVVSALTNEGRFESKPTKRRMPKDEYDIQPLPLYHSQTRKKEVDSKEEQTLGRSSIDNGSKQRQHKIKVKRTLPKNGARLQRRLSNKLNGEITREQTSPLIRSNSANFLVKPKKAFNRDANFTHSKQNGNDFTHAKVENKISVFPVFETSKTELVLPLNAERRKGNFSHRPSEPISKKLFESGYTMDFDKNLSDITKRFGELQRRPSLLSYSKLYSKDCGLVNSWQMSPEILPNKRSLTCSNNFIPMQLRTQPSNLSAASINCMKEQVLDNVYALSK